MSREALEKAGVRDGYGAAAYIRAHQNEAQRRIMDEDAAEVGAFIVQSWAGGKVISAVFRGVRYIFVLRQGARAITLVEGGGLAVHEALGGHLIRDHVGKSISQLLARAITDPMTRVASSFVSREVAEQAVAKTINANAAKIADWIAKGAKGRLPIEGAMQSGVGTVVTAEGAVVVSSSVRVVLVAAPQTAQGYRILTGFPTL